MGVELSSAFRTILWPELANMLITTGWAILAVAVGAILPPFRTARKLITRDVLPGILKALEAYTVQNAKTEQEEATCRQIQHAIVVGIHQKAELTIFEPRLSKCRRENLVGFLAGLIREVELLARYALLKHADSVTGGESYPPTLELLSGTARALASGDASGLLAQKQNEESNAEEPNQDAHSSTNRSYLTEIVYRHAQGVRDAAIRWLTD